jgi:hypothetical protein
MLSLVPADRWTVSGKIPAACRSRVAIAKLLGVSPGTLYNHIPELRELRASARTEIDA